MKTSTLSSIGFLCVLVSLGLDAPVMAQNPYELPVCDLDVAENNMGELEHVAVDIARRTLLAYYPKAASKPVKTLEVRVRPQGDVIHSYVKLEWTEKSRFKSRPIISEVYASFVYTTEIRRIYDLNYEDNTLISRRLCSQEPDIISAANKAFEQRDPVQMRAPLLSNRLSVMPPRTKAWINNCLRGDHGWHVYAAEDYIAPDWLHAEPPFPTQQ